jgi:predicted DCC family thiol-disulfide oxidoreductase YuxK
MQRESRPVLIYDGKCSFCSIWVRYWKKLTGGRIDYAPSEEAALRFPEISPEAFVKSVWLILPDGTRFSGAEAVFHLMEHGRGTKWPLMLYQQIPGVASLTEGVYRLIAQHRGFFYGLTRCLWGKDIEPASSGLTRSLFLCGLALTYFIAFASLIPQILGLIGERGIMPAIETFPTTLFFDTSDRFLHILPWVGIVLAAMLFFRILPMAAVVGLYVLYLNINRIGQDFLAFQWDVLLLETGFAAILVTPFGLFPRYGDRSTSRIGIWVLRFLIFRLMLESGLVKLLSGDPTWRNFTALTFHYETQPLPTPVAWYAHQLSTAFQKFSCAGVFAVELIVPFLFLMPRRLRILGAWITIAFQVVIAVTGNYTFFNFLTIVLCIPLLDDQHLYGLFRRAVPPTASAPRQWRWATIPAGTLLIGVGALQLLAMIGIIRQAPAVFPSLAIVNRYGLFAVMTTSRPEIVIEGSDDGLEWKTYEFKFKPGNVSAPIRWVAPYQPRLDWQMWFAALGRHENTPWFSRLMQRLLEGSPDVLALLEENPFPGKPPRVVRAVLYDYQFTDTSTRRATQAIWTRQGIGEYFPAVRLR